LVKKVNGFSKRSGMHGDNLDVVCTAHHNYQKEKNVVRHVV
jgi:hypothetical protein